MSFFKCLDVRNPSTPQAGDEQSERFVSLGAERPWRRSIRLSFAVESA